MDKFSLFLALGQTLEGSEQSKQALALTLIGKSDPQSFIVIDKASVPHGWALDPLHAKAIVTEEQGNYYVDLLLISDDEADIAEWLGNNDVFINFSASSWIIEVAHKVVTSLDINVLSKVLEDDYTTYSWDQILDIMAKDSVSTQNQFDMYIKAEHDNTSGKTLLSGSAYDPAEAVFSVPLFNSILKKVNNVDDVEFSFAMTPFRGRDTVFMRVKERNSNAVRYYDFTHKPPVIATASLEAFKKLKERNII